MLLFFFFLWNVIVLIFLLRFPPHRPDRPKQVPSIFAMPDEENNEDDILLAALKARQQQQQMA